MNSDVGSELLAKCGMVAQNHPRFEGGDFDPTRGADMQKAVLEKAGEGSRGGKVIGHTLSGKPVYQNHRAVHAAYRHFTAADHDDASSIHMGERDDHQAGKGRAKHHHSVSVGHEQTADRIREGEIGKAGEGSRGGNVIRHTRSGKPIYSHSHAAYTAHHPSASGRELLHGFGDVYSHHTGGAGYSLADHEDAAAEHSNQAMEARADSKRSDAKHHEAAADIHEKIIRYSKAATPRISTRGTR